MKMKSAFNYLKIFLAALLVVDSLGTHKYIYAQSDSLILDAQNYHEQLNAEYSDPESSPLTKEHLKDFTGLEFFPVDLRYRIEARFVRTPGQEPFKMATTGARSPIYEKYGEAHFTLDGKPHVLEIYQSHELRETEEYKDYLFLPFMDLTNGDESYGGGRYLELSIPQADTILLDFNKAYNPYCAYNKKYSCPLVPRQNYIRDYIRAGVKAFKD